MTELYYKKGCFMYKLMIVDDFDLDRLQMKELLPWDQLDIEVVYEAKHGEDAYQYYEQHPVDLIITDVQMPFMSGITLAKEIHKLHSHTKIIFMSYYREFEYLKSAIDVNAYGYFIKPFKSEEVQETIVKTIKELDKTRELEKTLETSKPLLLQQFMKDLLTGNYENEEHLHQQGAFLNHDLRHHHCQCIIFYRDMIPGADEHMARQNYIESLTLYEDLSSLTIIQQRGYLIKMDLQHQVLVLTSTTKEGLLDLSHELLEDVTKYLGTSPCQSTLVAISQVAFGYAGIHTAYQQSMTALRYKFHYRSHDFIYYEALSTHTTPQHEVNLNELLLQMRHLLCGQKYSQMALDLFIKTYLHSDSLLQDEIHYRSISSTMMMCLQILLTDQGLDIKTIYQKSFTKILKELNRLKKKHQLKSALSTYLNEARQALLSHHKKKSQHITDKVCTYIHENYMHEITVKSISTHFYYSANYLNNLFKKELNLSIPDYILNYRLQIAQRLLRERDMKIYEVIQAVGYRKASHFNQLFKKHTGQTPKEYRGV